jgi:hypothetical protein
MGCAVASGEGMAEPSVLVAPVGAVGASSRGSLSGPSIGAGSTPARTSFATSSPWGESSSTPIAARPARVMAYST